MLHPRLSVAYRPFLRPLLAIRLPISKSLINVNIWHVQPAQSQSLENERKSRQLERVVGNPATRTEQRLKF